MFAQAGFSLQTGLFDVKRRLGEATLVSGMIRPAEVGGLRKKAKTGSSRQGRALTLPGKLVPLLAPGQRLSTALPGFSCGFCHSSEARESAQVE